MKETTATPDADYPTWCDPRRTHRGLSNIEYFVAHRQWPAPHDDVTVRVDIARCDEIPLSGPSQAAFVGDVRARLHLCNHGWAIVDREGRELKPQVDVDLDPQDCRRLAANLLSAADRIEDLGGGR